LAADAPLSRHRRGAKFKRLSCIESTVLTDSTADNIHYAVSCDLKSSCSYAVDETKIPSGKYKRLSCGESTVLTGFSFDGMHYALYVIWKVVTVMRWMGRSLLAG